MKAFLSGVAAMIAIAVVAGFALNNLDMVTSGDRGTSDSGSVRLGESN